MEKSERAAENFANAYMWGFIYTVKNAITVGYLFPRKIIRSERNEAQLLYSKLTL